MAVIEIKVPSIAESITEVTLSQWLKEDGAIVKRDTRHFYFYNSHFILDFI